MLWKVGDKDAEEDEAELPCQLKLAEKSRLSSGKHTKANAYMEAPKFR